VSARARQLAAHVRRLSDNDLNDLLVELPSKRFAPLAKAALARPCVPQALALSFHRARPRQGETTRWDVLTVRPRRPIGAVARHTWPTRTGAQAAGWFAHTPAGASVRPPGTGWDWFGFARRADAAALLAWHSPASGARCLALAAHVRALGDDDLGDLLVELPPGRFDGLLRAALGAPVQAGEAA
jgi:hypothetical protein